jgi:dynactin complex subunit
MNKLIKIALVVVLLAGIGSLALTAKVAGTKQAQQTQIGELNTSLTQTKDELGRTKQGLQQANLAWGQTKDALDKANADLQATRVTLGQRDQEIQTAKTQLADNEKIVTEAKTKVAAADQAVEQIRAALKEAGVEDTANLDEVRTKLQASAQEKKVLAEQLEKTAAENTRLQQELTKAQAAPEIRTPVNLRGRVTYADAKWDFVVLDVGAREEVQPNAFFLIYRDSKLIGKAQILSVAQTTAIGQLLPEFAAGTPQAGDFVVH